MRHRKTYTYLKIGFVNQSTLCTQNYLQKIAICINLQLPIVILRKLITSDMRHRKTIFSKLGLDLVDLSTPCTQIYLQKIANYISLQLAIKISKNSVCY